MLPTFVIFLLVALVRRVQSQTETSLPIARYGGESSDSSGSYLTAVVDSGPIYYSNDSGVSWKVSDAPNRHYYAVAASSTGQYVIAGSSIATLVSSDYGQHFTTAVNITNGDHSVAVSSTGQYMVSLDNYYVHSVNAINCLSYSDNYGATFTTGLGPYTNSPSCAGIAIDASGTYVVLSAFSQGLWVSTNVLDKSAWNLTYATSVTISVISFGGASLYAIYSASPYYIIQSTDYGYNWTVKGYFPVEDIESLSVDSTGVNLLIAAGQLYLSQDSGATHNIIYPPAVITSAMNANATLAIFAAGSFSEINVFVGNPLEMAAGISQRRLRQ